MPQYDAIIIGAGMSGLTSGIRLAMFDKKVCILESHYVWGGLNSFYKKDGRSFDVGLHAMTNFARKGTKKGPLPMVARQLRLSIDDFQLLEQRHSLIKFPEHTLRFTNDLSDLLESIQQEFPQHVDEFSNLCQKVRDHDDGSLNPKLESARSVLHEIITEPSLIDMILCPLLFYGSATEHDMDWNQFVIMFKAIYFEGFSRPHKGVRVILKKLRETFLERGGELKTRCRVRRIRPQTCGEICVELETGETFTTSNVLSSAGKAETQKLLGYEPETSSIGRMSFVETIFCLDREPKALDIHSSITFFNQSSNGFSYRKPENLVDFTSGIFCCPNNFQDDRRMDGILRITNMANHDLWLNLKTRNDSSYEQAKRETIQTQLDTLESIVPKFRNHVIYTDSFTPCTIEHFTSHMGGAVYGSPKKVLSGESGTPNVFLCGTDQGYLGIVGAMLSGIIVANRHILH